MSDSSNDEQRLRATEAQMRRALGLDGQQMPAPAHQPSPAPPPNNVHRGHRRFVREGDVPVTILHHEHDVASGTNKLDETRKALREQIAAREQVERQLQEAQATIESFRTQLAHERIAGQEAVQRTEVARLEMEHALQATHEELAAERRSRQKAEQERDEVTAACQEAEDRLRDAAGLQQAEQPTSAAPKPKRPARAGNDSPTGKKPRPGRQRNVEESDSAYVEWWKPGWRDQFK